jgi:predicted lipoprotein
LDRVQVKGKRRGVDIYELLGFADEPLSAEMTQFCTAYEAALRLYWRRDWSAAQQQWLALQEHWPGDRSIGLMLERCAHLQAHPELAGEGWEGAYAFNSK